MCVVIDSAVWFSLGCGNLALRAVQLGRKICSVDQVVQWELRGSPSRADLEDAGLRVEEVGPKGMARIEIWGQDWPGLSVGDRLSLALAWERGWALATRDTELEMLAKIERVPVLDVADVLGAMAQTGLLTSRELARFKRGMYNADRPYDKRKLREVEKMLRASGR